MQHFMRKSCTNTSSKITTQLTIKGHFRTLVPASKNCCSTQHMLCRNIGQGKHGRHVNGTTLDVPIAEGMAAFKGMMDSPDSRQLCQLTYFIRQMPVAAEYPINIYTPPVFMSKTLH